MNILLIISLVIVGLGVVIFIGSAIAAAVGAKEPGQYIIGRMQKMQSNIMPIQTEVVNLQGNIQHIKETVDAQKLELQQVKQSFIGIKSQVQQLNLTSKRKAHESIAKAEQDPAVQQNVAEYTEKAMNVLQRN